MSVSETTPEGRIRDCTRSLWLDVRDKIQSYSRVLLACSPPSEGVETGEGVDDDGEEGDDDGDEEESDVAVVRPVSVVEAATALCPVDGVERWSSLLLPRLFWEKRDSVRQLNKFRRLREIASAKTRRSR